MYLSELYQRLSAINDSITISCPDPSPYGHLGAEIQDMICSYLQDSLFFERSGDTVNQYASLAYLHGWLSAGLYLGLLTSSDDCRDEVLLCSDVSEGEQLTEKTQRYHRMLKSALRSVKILPGEGSPVYPGALHCITLATQCLKTGSEMIEHNQQVSALGELSYGYGWLDTAVRSGLLGITANPELFTTEL